MNIRVIKTSLKNSTINTNSNQKGEPNYQNINSYAINGAVHYANAILKCTSFSDIIAIGVTGHKNTQGKIIPQIGVYFVSKDNFGIGQKVGEFNDLSFLRNDNFSKFTEKLRTLKLSSEEIAKINEERDKKIEDVLRKLTKVCSINKRTSVHSPASTSSSPVLWPTLVFQTKFLR